MKRIFFAYHDDFNKYDLGKDHPLIGDKPRRTLQFLKERNFESLLDIKEPEPAREKDILKVHTNRYLEEVRFLSEKGGYLSLDTPVPKGLYNVALLAVGGTLLAGEALFRGYNISVNPLGGFHHACRDRSSGFCIFNDIAVVIEYLKEKYDIGRIAVIDLDVHHANGTQEIYYEDPSVLLISFHQDGRTLYPGTGFIDEIGKGKGEGYTINHPFLPLSGNESYIYAFKEVIPEIVRKFKPHLIIYQAGVDTHHADPLASILLTYPIYHFFAQEIKELSKQTCKRLLVLLGGGYNSISSIKSYYNIMCGLAEREDIINEEEIRDVNFSKTRKTTKELMEILSSYW